MCLSTTWRHRRPALDELRRSRESERGATTSVGEAPTCRRARGPCQRQLESSAQQSAYTHIRTLLRAQRGAPAMNRRRLMNHLGAGRVASSACGWGALLVKESDKPAE